MTSRTSLTSTRGARFTASAVALAVGVGSGLVLATGTLLVAAPAHAEGTATYSCTAPVVGPQDSTSTYDTNLPESVPAGSAALDVAVSSSGVAKASATGQAWSLLGARKMSANSQMPISIGSEARTVSMTGPTVPINNGGDTVLLADGSWGSWTPPATPQAVEVSMAGAYKTTINLLKDNGSHTSMSPQNSDCTVKSGQNRVIDTVYVTATSTTTVQAVSLDLTEGDSLEVSAEVAVSAGSAAGKVEFKAGEKKLVVNLANGKASGVITGLEAGTYPLTATFVPTQPKVYLTSASAEALVNVSPAVPATPTTTTLSLDRSTASTDDVVKATVTVAAGAETPAGSARVVVNGKPVSGALANGTVTVDLPKQRAGSYPVTASFVPSNPKQYAPSAAGPVTLTVTPGAGGDLRDTSTWLQVPKTQVKLGTTQSVTAVVSAEDGSAPDGRVVFGFDARTMAAPVVNGRAVISLPYLPLGEYRVSAEFVPNAGYSPSSADARTFVVVATPLEPGGPGTPSATALTLTAPSKPVAGTSATVTARVTVTGGSAAIGTVTFRAGTSTAVARVVNANASAKLAIRAAGATVVTAVFTPADPTAQKSSLASRTVTAVRATSRSTVTAKAVQRVVTVTVRTASDGARCQAPVKLTWTKGARRITRTVKASCAGVARSKVSMPSAGRWTVTALYQGNDTTSSSRASVTVRVR